MAVRKIAICGLVGLALLALLASGAAVASREDQPSVTISSASVSAKWRQSWLKGHVTFTFVTTAASQLEVTLRSEQTHELNTRPLELSVGAGSFTKTIQLSARPVPGTYSLRITGTSGGTTIPAVQRLLTIHAPVEGVVDRWYTSRTKDGPPTHVIRGAHQIFAHFHFLVRPQVQVVTFVWQKPGNPKVRYTGYAKKKYHETVWTFVRAKRLPHGYAYLRKGEWYCFIRASGRVVVRIAAFVV